MQEPHPYRDNARNLHSENAMDRDSLEIVRQTKLDLAQWIASGIGRCQNQATAITLAKYAAAQLEAAASIPRPARITRASLLRKELRSSNRKLDCLIVIDRVSRSMLRLLVASRDITCMRLARHELRAVRSLRSVVPREIAA